MHALHASRSACAVSSARAAVLSVTSWSPPPAASATRSARWPALTRSAERSTGPGGPPTLPELSSIVEQIYHSAGTERPVSEKSSSPACSVSVPSRALHLRPQDPSSHPRIPHSVRKLVSTCLQGASEGLFADYLRHLPPFAGHLQRPSNTLAVSAQILRRWLGGLKLHAR